MKNSPFKANLFQILLSYFIPIHITKRKGEFNQDLDFYIYKNQWQLGTGDILYSDGKRYMPFRMAFENMPDDFLKNIESCLILGVGLGSVVQILHNKYKSKPHFSLVEIDGKILTYAQTLLHKKGINNLKPIHRDAKDFIVENQQKFDLICIDVFIHRYVPPFFLQKVFFDQLKSFLNDGGMWVMNYIKNQESEMIEFLNNVQESFQDVKVLQEGDQVVLIGYQ